MPLSKERNRARMKIQMRAKRLMLQPKSEMFKPKSDRTLPDVQPKLEVVQPNRYLAAHMRVYPEGFNVDGSYRKDYDPKLDPYINPMLRSPEPLPNCRDGRYRFGTS